MALANLHQSCIFPKCVRQCFRVNPDYDNYPAEIVADSSSRVARSNDEMNVERWQKAKSIFTVAAELDPAARDAYVVEACDSDPILYSEVKSLLKNLDEAGGFLSIRPSSGDASLSEQHPTLAKGRMVGDRFSIVKFVGGGGMGEVYEAFDQLLQERVALKMIRPTTLSEPVMARFRQEVLLARRVTHPNVCRVFDLAEYASPDSGNEIVFLTMEFLEGETLRARLIREPRLSLDERLDIIGQIAAALAASHAVGVIHRDLKPSNVILAAISASRSPRVVVTDFGVARLTNAFSWSNQASATPLTGKSEIVGTFDYMAPEQVEGGNITPATDIYALGLLMYEMFTGRKAFLGDTPLSRLALRVKGPPVSPRTVVNDLDIGLEMLILDCLVVDPARRIQDAALVAKSVADFRVARDSESTIRRPAAAQASIAVLPFANIGADAENDYFSDGLAEELIGVLNRVEGLRVVARTSAFRYRGSGLDIREVARELNVNVIVEGAVRRDGNRFRITVRLVNAREGYLLWSDRYDREMEDVFAVQEEIANTVAAQLQMNLGPKPGTHFVQHRTQDITAYNLFLKGRFFAGKRTPGNLQKAVEHFNLALQRDSHFAPAWAALADCCVIQGVYGSRAPREVFPFAKETVFKALALASQMAEAHCALGCIQAIYDRDWGSAEQSFQRALELDSNDAIAHHSYALYCLIPQARFVEARRQIQLALRNDPLSLAINTSVAVQSYFERRYDDAVSECKNILEMDPNFGMAHFFMGQVYEQKGMYAEAAAALERAVILTERSAETLAWLGRAYALAGDTAKACTLLEELKRDAVNQYISPVLLAALLLGLRETEDALDQLEIASASSAADLIWIGVRPVFDELHVDPRFQDICRSIGLRWTTPA